jgi:CBS domain-containing protein
MDERGVRRLPVVRDGRLVGIITRGDLRAAQPSHATTLSVYEWRALLSQVSVAECMTHNPITITPDAPALAAAEQMLAHKIGGLPVVQGECVVGVITEIDLLRLLIADETRLEELMVGAR